MLHILKILEVLFLPLCLAVLLSACEHNKDEESNSFSSEDQEKFLGTWSGKYGCGDTMLEDEVIITTSPDELGFNITIHANFLNSDTVTGLLENKNIINIPEQTMGGFPGTAKVIYSDDSTFTFSQSSFGITCNGIGYVKKEENNPPVAHAGNAINVSTSDNVILDSSKSSDPNSDELNFSWSIVKLPDNSSISLSDVNSESPSFTPDQLGLYVFSLIVSDGEFDSEPHEVSILANHGLLFFEDFSETDLSKFLTSDEYDNAVTVENQQLLLSPVDPELRFPYVTIDTSIFTSGFNSILNDNNAVITYAFNLSNYNAEVCGACNNTFRFNISSSKELKNVNDSFGYSLIGGGYTTDRMVFVKTARWNSPYGNVSDYILETENGLQVLPAIGAFKIKFYPSTGTWEMYFEQSIEKIDPKKVSTLIMSIVNDDFTSKSLPYISFVSGVGGGLYIDNISISMDLEDAIN